MEQIFTSCKPTNLHQVLCQQTAFKFDPLINKQYLSLTPIKMNKNGIVSYPFSAEICRFVQMINGILSSVWAFKEMNFFT